MNDWNFQSRARACRACGQGFADRQPYHTLLFEERQGYDRHDVCPACWEAQYRHGATERRGFVSHWQGVFAAPPAAPPEPIPRESAESLLRRLAEQGAADHHAAMFILAAMLERKRQLKVRDQLRQDGRRTFVYELPRTGEVFTIVDPELRLSELEAVQREVASLLERGLPGDGQPAGAPGNAADAGDPPASGEAPALAAAPDPASATP